MRLLRFCLLHSLSLLGHATAGWTNESEVPYYGLSPPVYPSRKLDEVFRYVLVVDQA